jgi:hypothetical protein
MESLAAAGHTQEKLLTVDLAEALGPMAQLAAPKVQERRVKETRVVTHRPLEDQAEVVQVPLEQTLSEVLEAPVAQVSQTASQTYRQLTAVAAEQVVRHPQAQAAQVAAAQQHNQELLRLAL